MVNKKDEHYVNNEEFYEILMRNKQIVEEFFWNDIKDIDFSKWPTDVKKLKFIKQLTKFELAVIKEKIRSKEISFKKNKRLPDNILSLKPDKQFPIYMEKVVISTKVRKDIDKLKHVETLALRVKEIKRRKSKQLMKLLITTNNSLCRDPSYKKLQNKLGRIFLDICHGVLTKPNFINYTWDRKDDMISEATFHMSRYVLLFDVEQKNPFAYFTTVCNRAYLQCLNKQNKYTDKFQPLEYIENMHKKDNNINDWD